MKIVGLTDGRRRVLLLDTGKKAPSRERALLLSRSITMLGEYYLLDGQPVDADGLEIPAEEAHEQVLRAIRTGDDSVWRQFALPDVNTLLSLS